MSHDDDHEWPKDIHGTDEAKAADWLLYINPKGLASPEPLVDGVTLKMTRLWRCQQENEHAGQWRGFHTCICRAMSSSQDHVIRLPNKLIITNALCIHYLAHHRDEVPREVLAQILCYDEPAPVPLTMPPPTEKELQGWLLKGEKMKTRFR